MITQRSINSQKVYQHKVNKEHEYNREKDKPQVFPKRKNANIYSTICYPQA